MKKVLLLFSTVLLFACSNENNNQNSEEAFNNATNLINRSLSHFEEFSKEALINFDFETIGIEHNLGLEYIYSEIYLNQVELKYYSISEQESFIRNSVQYYMGNSYYKDDISPSNLSTLLSSTNLSDDLSNKIDPSELNLYSLNAINSYDSIFTNLDEFTENESFDVSEYKIKARNLEHNLKNDLNEDLITKDEYFTLRTMIVVSVYSLEYWDSNLINWNNIYNSETLAKGNNWYHIKRGAVAMGKADLLSAGVGLVFGGVYGFFTGGPAGALLGAASTAVGMGMNGSAVAGFKYIYDNS